MRFEVKELYKNFGQKRVLEGVGFTAVGGKALGLLGRNGAGKTTTIRIIMGVFGADSGSMQLNGAPFNRHKLKMGYLPEEHGLYAKVEITPQLLYLAQLRGMSKNDAKASIKHWMERLEMQEYANRKLETLSKGNQQKIQLVAALVTNPDFVILDEPFSGLDPVNASLLKDVVNQLIASGKVVLFSSHQMSYVEEFCDSIAILHGGKIVLAGELEAIKKSYDRSKIVVRSNQLAQMEAYCLQELSPLVAGVTVLGNDLHLQLQDSAQKSQLMGAFASQGFDIDNFSVFEPSLNDIFVEYTGNGEVIRGEKEGREK